MIFSKTIQSRAKAPINKVSDVNLSDSILIKLEKFNSYLEVGFSTEKTKDGDDLFTDLCFKTVLEGEHVGIIDGLLDLYKNRAVKAVTRISAKELDQFLRDNTSDPSVSYYGPKFYEILAIGEKINKKLYPVAEKESFLFESFDGNFFELAFTEQIELFEEFLSAFIYKNEKYFGIQFDLDDTDNNKLVVSLDKKLNESELEEFSSTLKKQLGINTTIEFTH